MKYYSTGPILWIFAAAATVAANLVQLIRAFIFLWVILSLLTRKRKTSLKGVPTNIFREKAILSMLNARDDKMRQ